MTECMRNRGRHCCRLMFLVLVPAWACAFAPDSHRDPLDSCNVVVNVPGVWYEPPWRKRLPESIRPGPDASMPIGNGNLGANVSIDKDLVLLLSKTDSWNENGVLAKLGRVRVSFAPNPFVVGLPFRQELRLRQGEIEIIAGREDSQVTVRIWADANHPVIRLEAASTGKLQMQVSLEPWHEKHSPIKSASDPLSRERRNTDVASPDTIVPGEQRRVIWYHKNATSAWPLSMHRAGLDAFAKQASDPLLGRIYGGAITGEGMKTAGDRTVVCLGSGKRCTVSIHGLTMESSTVDTWLQKIKGGISAAAEVPIERARQSHRQWWREFWERSWIRIRGDDEGIAVSKAYTLFRYLLACAGRGPQPIKANGSIFTWEQESNPVFRGGHSPYRWSAERMLYWPMMASGDFDLMQPLFRTYAGMVPAAREKARRESGKEGALLPECAYFWGAPCTTPQAECDANHGLELLALMIDFYAFTEDRKFLKKTLLPAADAFLPPGAPAPSGKEHSSFNLAGLHFVLEQLSRVVGPFAGNERRRRWSALRSSLPPRDAATGAVPAGNNAKTVAGARGAETLYMVFPFRLVGLRTPGLDVARQSFRACVVPPYDSPGADSEIYASFLGLTSVARSGVSARLGPRYIVSSFPVFWQASGGPAPDHRHGGVGMMALQSMLMQERGADILLLPAWPGEWDVDFKLHASRRTVVEGRYREGNLETLKVTPRARARDVRVLTAGEGEKVAQTHVSRLPETVRESGANLAWLDLQSDPYYPSAEFPKLTVPQWVGEPGVDAVLIFSIDNLGNGGIGSAHYEQFLRPLIDRLKQIDGRAPISIMTNEADSADPQLRKWLAEGLNLETHTVGHPCPMLQGGDLEKARLSYEASLHQVHSVLKSNPVAFRLPCCDAVNSASPRFYAEIFNRTAAGGLFSTIDSSVAVVLTPQDSSLPPNLARDSDGRSKFEKYIPDLTRFVNFVQDYPYPYVLGRLAWQFPFMMLDDFNGFRVNRLYYNSLSFRDLKAAVDAMVVKQGTFTYVFHPHRYPTGWIRSEELAALVDYAQQKHGSRMKFMNFREAQQRIDRNLLEGHSLRAPNGQDNGVRVLDLNNDGFQDVAVGNEHGRLTRIWVPGRREWRTASFPVALVDVDGKGERTDSGVRFGVLGPQWPASLLVKNETAAGLWHFDGSQWTADAHGLAGLSIDGRAVDTSIRRKDQGVRFRDVDQDGRCELLVANPGQHAMFRWSEQGGWVRMTSSMPEEIEFVDGNGVDAGLRFVDLNGDGFDDILFSNDTRYSIHLWDPAVQAWDRLRGGKAGEPGAVPPIVKRRQNNGAWFRFNCMWVANEDTGARLEVRTFEELLRK